MSDLKNTIIANDSYRIDFQSAKNCSLNRICHSDRIFYESPQGVAALVPSTIPWFAISRWIMACVVALQWL
jgi:hypothetical protein